MPVTPVLSFSVFIYLGLVQHSNADEGEAEVADLGEHAVQLRLVPDETCQGGCAVVVLSQGEIVEPSGPMRVKVSGDPELVARR
jgi:hypothetical protein